MENALRRDAIEQWPEHASRPTVRTLPALGGARGRAGVRARRVDPKACPRARPEDRGPTTEELSGYSFSAMAEFARRRLDKACSYLILDVREAGIIRSQAVLLGIGIGWDGRRSILAVERILDTTVLVRSAVGPPLTRVRVRAPRLAHWMGRPRVAAHTPIGSTSPLGSSPASV